MKRFNTLMLICMIVLLAVACRSGEETVLPEIPTPTTDAANPAAQPEEEQEDNASITKPGAYSQQQLIEDVWQLADIIESTHPDPYINGGGKVAFHRRLQHLLAAIPPEGLTRDEFVRLLRPFIGAVGDSHTDIWNDYEVNSSSPGGVPLLFDISEQSLYVSGIPKGVDRDLIGSTLVSVEGVPLAELIERQDRLRGENEYHALDILTFESLWYKPHMQDLIPEWQDTDQVTVDLKLSMGEIQTHTFDLPQSMTSLTTPETQVIFPAVNAAGIAYNFYDAERTIAYLRVEHMTNYRERCELQNDPQTNCAAIPSATESFRDLVIEMEAAGTETLIIDLRDNEGGDSAMSDILIYFLYGKETLLSVKTAALARGGGEVTRYSELFLEPLGRSIEEVNQGTTVPLRVGDYDFIYDFTDDPERFQVLLPQAQAIIDNIESTMPTFYAEYEEGTYAGFYTPDHVVVLVTPGTFSAGFDMLRYLYEAGAILVGTPSGQAANCFGNGRMWNLKHTKIEGIISTKYEIWLPGDTELGRVLPMDYPLTYEKLASYNFDPNAEFLYALDLLPQLGE